mmetsp:Transcript_77835/g.209772  ORF Transcript_77835/g.209772 Transcript_77835/m.209772 type:complete len:190 (-) Transcript_77835:822-1391(-)
MDRSRSRGVIARIIKAQGRARNKVHPLGKDNVRRFHTNPEVNEHARGLLELVRASIETRQGYLRLCSLLVFFVIYAQSLLYQQRVESSFEIESSILMGNIMMSLPQNGQVGFFNAAGAGSTGMFTDPGQIVNWLGQTIIPALFQDPVCGDGSCDADEEASIGRFGCFKDCGKVPADQTVKIEVLVAFVF